MQEALGRKEASEQGLVVELESLREQLQWVTQQQAELREENATLWSQKEALATGAEEREAGKKCQFQGVEAGAMEGRRVGSSCRLSWKLNPSRGYNGQKTGAVFREPPSCGSGRACEGRGVSPVCCSWKRLVVLVGMATQCPHVSMRADRFWEQEPVWDKQPRP